MEHSSKNKPTSQPKSPRAGRNPTNIPWSQVFEHVPHSDYFKGLKEPAEINHIAYFKHCDVPYAHRQHYHNIWTILPIVKGTTIQRVAAQRTRLNQEWKAKAETDRFWSGVMNDELEAKARASNKRQIIVMREQVVDQLENTYEYYSKRTRILNSKDAEHLQQHVDLASSRTAVSDNTNRASMDKGPTQGMFGMQLSLD
ncbi:MAG: hypothetical protein J3R72DRAFT_152702 [Linnemannia gamsii]|nr:MAG: hypothetical protein J3R72DRAFT_152702 [Linnemannia gamsii]